MYRKGPQGWLKHLDFMVLDMLCLHMAFLGAFMLYNGPHNPYQSPIYRNMALVLTFIDAGIMVFFEPMKNVLKRRGGKEIKITVRHVLLVTLAASLYLFYTQTAQAYSRLTFGYMAVLYGALSYYTRILRKRRLKRRNPDKGKRSLLIVTSSRNAKTAAEDINNYNYEMFRVAGLAVIDEDLRGREICGIPVVANRESATDYACRHWVDEVFFNLPDEEPYPEGLACQFTEMGVVVHVKVMKLSRLPYQKRFVERLGVYTVLTTSINYMTDWQMFMKRALDIAGGFTGVVMAAALFVFLAPAIYIQSPGPVIFSQIRVGKNGKRFRLYKFRSMYLDAEERKKELMGENRVKDGRMFKLDWDPRIIGSRKEEDGRLKKGIGNFMRDWSLDEFPQFFNVLKGDMSLVGTRPPTVEEWEKYALHHRARLAVKPGITGMWQVNGRSRITDFEEVVKLDMEYITEWSLGLDIKLILKTIKVVVMRDGAL